MSLICLLITDLLPWVFGGAQFVCGIAQYCVDERRTSARAHEPPRTGKTQPLSIEEDHCLRSPQLPWLSCLLDQNKGGINTGCLSSRTWEAWPLDWQLRPSKLCLVTWGSRGRLSTFFGECSSGYGPIFLKIPLWDVWIRDGLERVEVPNASTLGDLKLAIVDKLHIPVEDIKLSKDSTLVSLVPCLDRRCCTVEGIHRRDV